MDYTYEKISGAQPEKRPEHIKFADEVMAALIDRFDEKLMTESFFQLKNNIVQHLDTRAMEFNEKSKDFAETRDEFYKLINSIQNQ